MQCYGSCKNTSKVYSSKRAGRAILRTVPLPIFPFRTRNSQRDSQTDTGRLQRLHKALSGIRSEMESERNGLRERYEDAMANAAFSQQLVEDHRGTVGMSSKVEDMTGAMMWYTKRIGLLQKQIDFVTDMSRSIEAFMEHSAEPPTVL
jgi:hypothetical protein